MFENALQNMLDMEISYVFIYLCAWFYNTVIVCFIQEDTYRENGLNLYAYCANNMVYYVDLSGFDKDVFMRSISSSQLVLPASLESSFNVGKRLVSKSVFENYILDPDTDTQRLKDRFLLGSPSAASTFISKPVGNIATNSLYAAI